MEYFAAQGFETHAISLPGHGNSSMNKRWMNLYTPRDYLEVLTREIEAMPAAPVVISHSLGGGILLKYLENRQLPAAVFLSSISTTGMAAMLGRMLVRYPGAMLKAMLTMNLYYIVQQPETVKELFLTPDTPIDVVKYQRQLSRETYNSPSLIIPFGRVNSDKSPMLFLMGEKDNLITIAEGKTTAGKYGEELVILPGQPHSAMLDAGWQAAAERIVRWLCDILE
ncbi:MAG: hypothetical protein HFACDABA_00070 [Anaerolineales bacterium]|nr:hypothetical protein [Anaerolineales bacterium]